MWENTPNSFEFKENCPNVLSAVIMSKGFYCLSQKPIFELSR